MKVLPLGFSRVVEVLELFSKSDDGLSSSLDSYLDHLAGDTEQEVSALTQMELGLVH